MKDLDSQVLDEKYSTAFNSQAHTQRQDKFFRPTPTPKFARAMPELAHSLKGRAVSYYPIEPVLKYIHA